MFVLNTKMSHAVSEDEEICVGGNLFYKGLQAFALPKDHQDAINIINNILKPGANVLELGAGAGAFTLRLQENGFQVKASGIEPDTFRLKDVHYYIIDLNKEDIAPEHLKCYEAVIAIEVIEHIENGFEFFRKINAMLQDHGMAIISTPNIGCMLSRLCFLNSFNFLTFSPELLKSIGHINPLPYWLMQAAAEQAGFRCAGIFAIGEIKNLGFIKKVITDTLVFIKKSCHGERFPGELTKPGILVVFQKSR